MHQTDFLPIRTLKQISFKHIYLAQVVPKLYKIQ